jgi:hypothetical protein
MVQLSLVIPGLHGPAAMRRQPAARQDLRLPALEQLLSRATRRHVAAHGMEAVLCELFGIALPAEGDAPVAAVTRQWEAGDADGDWWLRADPVYLQADRDRVVMLGNESLALSAEECAGFAAELNAHFAADGWDLRAPNARRWYLRLKRAPHLFTTPLAATVGRDVLHHMPEGDDAASWRSALNEAQMVLHASAINRRREAQGQLPVNSLWFWGGGRLPPAPPRLWSQAWANEALARALAALGATPCHSLPEDAAEWLEERHDEGAQLLLIESLRDPAQLDDVEGWREAVTVVDEAWLRPLWEALRRRRLAVLDIHPADGAMFRITARDARRWWPRRRPAV